MILVTGASGFVGRHMVRALKRRFPTEPVRALTLTKPSAEVLPEGVEIFIGALEQSELSAAVVQDADVVIHLAAKVQPDSREITEMRRVNVEGTEKLYSAAISASCKTFLHVSSAGIYGPARSPDPRREQDVCTPVTPYQVTKWEAEQALNQIDPLHTVLNIVRPGGMYGPGSYLEIPTYRKILVQNWSVEPAGDVIVHPTHVRDVIDAVMALIEHPASHGMVFNVGGERALRVNDLHALVAETLGVRRKRITLPVSIAGPVGGMAGALFAFIGRPKPLLAPMCRGRLLSLAVDDSRFRQLYPTVPVVKLLDGLREHIEWARSHRLLSSMA
jgi:nucleoside-diphosphate-sugar epimerase